MADKIIKQLTLATASAALCLLVIDTCPASAVTFTVSDTTSLINAINAANSSPEDDIISFSSSITLTSQLPLIGGSGSFNFDGMGRTLNGASQFQGFFVNSATVSFNNLAITNGLSRGGNGADGGGGGAGLGGGLFINSGMVTIDSVTFSGNQALGGNGGVGFGGAGLGGAIFINSGSLTLNNSTFARIQVGSTWSNALPVTGFRIIVQKTHSQ